MLSEPLSAIAERPVWLKMECDQPPGSFKIRGVGLHCQRLVEAGATHLVSSSGGNAGLAAAWAGARLGVPTTVVVPETTPDWIRARIRTYGAEVVVHGAVWDEAHRHAQTLAEVVVNPFDHQDLWDGHQTLIEEAALQCERPGAVVCAVGGGGLLCGVLQGMAAVGWEDVPVIAVETDGAASYRAALDAGRPVTIDAITSIAKSMGALTVCRESVTWAARHPIQSVLVSDRQATTAIARFCTDHRVLVEPACGASLAVVYDGLVDAPGPILVVVCGGAVVRSSDLAIWERL